MTTNKTALAVVPPQEQDVELSVLEKLVIGGDISVLTPDERWIYYKGLCARWGLDPMSQPLSYLPLGQKGKDGAKKLVLYVTSGATAQIGDNKGVSRRIISKGREGDIYVAVVEASTRDGRVTQVMAAIPLRKPEMTWVESDRPGGKGYMEATGQYKELEGDDLANAMMKTCTKADRRAVLSHVGLSMFMDETEISTITSAGESIQQIVPQTTGRTTTVIDQTTGEITTPAKPADVTREELQALAATLRELAPDEDVTLPDKMTRGEARHFKQLWENAIAVARVASNSDQDAADDSFGMPEGSV